ncbi:MAG: ATP-binding protein [Thermocrinis sp.]|jgi:DNA helicase HerA-like ATPase|uniref:ATP-binding protein n=1 Tax=Thermocrinis sp. TaxID=2024383 RepID=UPI003C0C76F6
MGIRWEDLERDLKNSRQIREFLKERFGMYRTEIDRYISGFVEKIKRGELPSNIWLWEKAIPDMDKKNPAAAELIRLIIDRIRSVPDRYGFVDEPEEGNEEDTVESQEVPDKLSGIIGRVSITQKTPATPYEFYFWLKTDDDIHIEPGEFIEVNLENGKIAVGTVEEIQSVSEIDSPISDFYGFMYGQPEEEPITETTIIRIGKARIIHREDGVQAPFIKNFAIRKSMARDIEPVLQSMVKPKNRVLLGFVEDGFSTLVPVYGDYEHIFGYKAAHVNITGKSGVAGKTSYALFLIASALSKQNEERSLAVVGFNVKEKDLLSVKDFDYDSLDSAILHLEKIPERREDASMWAKAKQEGIDPIKVFRERSHTFEPAEDYYYGLQDLLKRGPYVFLSLFEPSDVDDKFESLVLSIAEQYGDGRTSFKQLMKELMYQLTNAGNKQNIYIADSSHHVSTVQKFLNRLNKILNSRVLIKDKPWGRPLNISNIEAGDFWIIDINPLKDSEKRMVFFSILSDLSYILENRKQGDPAYITFPSRVAIFVDELNKFAPSTRSLYSPIKHFLIDIAARGRSIGLSLIGAEQFASQIDEEILGNCSTYLIGKTDSVELSNKFYKKLSEGLLKRVENLKAGQSVLIHEAIRVPIFIRYPIPLHRVGE